MSEIIRIGIVNNYIGKVYAKYVSDILLQSGLHVEIVPIDIIDKKKKQNTSNGSYFSDIETCLKNETVDIIVFASEDTPLDISDDYEILAFTKRVPINDVLITTQDKLSIVLSDPKEEKIEIGTSSNLFKALLNKSFPFIKSVDITGNLEERIKKMASGTCDGIIMPFSQIQYMGYWRYITEILDVNTFTPVVGQGSIGIKSLKSFKQNVKTIIRDLLNDINTEISILTEKTFYKNIDETPNLPIFAITILKENNIQLIGGVVSLNGKTMVKDYQQGELQHSLELAHKLAENIWQKGGCEIIEKVKIDMAHQK